MTASLGDLASLVSGQLTGDETTPISGAAVIAQAKSGDITLADGESFVSSLATSDASAAVVPADAAVEDIPCIAVENVHQAFAKIVAHFRPPKTQSVSGVSPAAFVDPSAQIPSDCTVHPGATLAAGVRLGNGCEIHSGARILAGCQLGDEVVIYPNVVLYDDTELGSRVTIHATAVIGAFGFGYQIENGRHQRSPQLGYVQIGDDVEIGAGTTIDRGTYGPTIIGAGTKIDNQVMIGHNCQIGKHNIICSQVGIAGSTRTGDYVILAGQAGVRDHVTLGDRVRVGAKSGIMNDVPDDTTMIGSPAMKEREFFHQAALERRLPSMHKQLKTIKKFIDAMESSS